MKSWFSNSDLSIFYYTINLPVFQSQSHKKLGKEYRRAKNALNKLITIRFFGLLSPSPDTASKRAKGIYETPKKKQGRKNGRNLSKSPVFSCFLVRIDFDHTTWQGQQDLNPRPTVLETATLPTELYPYASRKDCCPSVRVKNKNTEQIFNVFALVHLQGFEPGTH